MAQNMHFHFVNMSSVLIVFIPFLFAQMMYVATLLLNITVTKVISTRGLYELNERHLID